MTRCRRFPRITGDPWIGTFVPAGPSRRAAPIHLARKQLELLSSVGRSWMPKVPGEASTDSKVEIVRGHEAAQVLNLSREQRRRMGRQNRG